MAKPIPPLCQM
uniref:Uncharacterized protein n=1 Tax=Moniliophthora roreri TaxID=221103 RepID=A0A0W0FBY1_MONRR